MGHAGTAFELSEIHFIQSIFISARNVQRISFLSSLRVF